MLIGGTSLISTAEILSVKMSVIAMGNPALSIRSIYKYLKEYLRSKAP